jgi:hypothetical protein
MIKRAWQIDLLNNYSFDLKEHLISLSIQSQRLEKSTFFFVKERENIFLTWLVHQRKAKASILIDSKKNKNDRH